MTRNEKRLQALLYLLLRENLTFGQLEKQMEVVNKCFESGNWPIFSEKTQARYARVIVHQLLKKPLRKFIPRPLEKLKPIPKPQVGDTVQYLGDGRQGELVMKGEVDGREWGRVKFTELVPNSCRVQTRFETKNLDELIPVITGDERKRSNYPV
jgi:hypothetical protein